MSSFVVATLLDENFVKPDPLFYITQDSDQTRPTILGDVEPTCCFHGAFHLRNDSLEE